MADLSIARHLLGRPQQIGSGAYSRVYGVPSFTLPDEPFALAYKQYKRKVLPVSTIGLSSIVRVRKDMPEQQRKKLDERTTWPLRLVEHDGSAVGLLMRLIPEQFFQSLRLRDGSREIVGRELQYLWQDRKWCMRTDVGFPNPDARLAVLRELAYTLALLHKAKIVYGDVSAKNILYSVQPHISVMLVDCDAVRLAGTSAVFGRQPHSPDFEPPEALAAQAMLARLAKAGHSNPQLISMVSRHRHAYSVQNIPTDTYKFALTVIRTLAPGAGNSTSRDGSSVRRFLSTDAQRLLDESLSSNPADRPTMRTWVEALSGRRALASSSGAARMTQNGASPRPNHMGRREGRWVQQRDGSWLRDA